MSLSPSQIPILRLKHTRTLKKWTEHFKQSYFLKLQLGGDLGRTPGTPFVGFFLDHDLYYFKKFTSRSFFFEHKLYLSTNFDKLWILASYSNLSFTNMYLVGVKGLSSKSSGNHIVAPNLCFLS